MLIIRRMANASDTEPCSIGRKWEEEGYLLFSYELRAASYELALDSGE